MLILLLLVSCTCGLGIDPIGDTTDAAWACGKSSVTVSSTNDQDCDDAKDNVKKTFIILGLILVGGICLLVVCCTCGPCIALKLTEVGCKCIAELIELTVELIWRFLRGCYHGCYKFFKEWFSLMCCDIEKPKPPDLEACEFAL